MFYCSDYEDRPDMLCWYRQLTLVLSVLVLVSNASASYLTYHLPDDPHHLAAHVSLYSYFACALGALGFIGAKKVWPSVSRISRIHVLTKSPRQRNATLVTIFSNYLCIDVVIGAIPRILFIMIFPEIRSALCSAETINMWLYAQSLQTSLDPTQPVDFRTLQKCRSTVAVVQGVLGLMAVGSMVLQILLAIRVCTFAGLLRSEECIGAHDLKNTALADMQALKRDFKEKVEV